MPQQKQQQKQQQKPGRKLLKASPTIIKVIVIIIVIYVIYSVITSIFAFVSKPLKALSNILGPGGLDPNSTKTPWWVWIGIAWYCGLFGVAKAGMSKVAQNISFHTGDSIKQMAEKYNLNEAEIEKFSKEAGNENLSADALGYKFQTEKLYKPRIKEYQDRINELEKQGEQMKNQIEKLQQEMNELSEKNAEDAEKFNEGEIEGEGGESGGGGEGGGI